MPNIATGTFSPLHEVKPNPEESDWAPPTDLPVAEEISRSMTTGSEDLEDADFPTDQILDRPVGKDKVSTALAIILGELEGESRRLNAEGADLFGQSRYLEAAIRAEEGKKLQDFRQKVIDLRAAWLSVGKSGGLREFHVLSATPADAGSGRRAGVRRKFSVVFEDGDVIMEGTAVGTFAKCISRIGVERVKELDLRSVGLPLLLDDAGKDRWPVEGYYVDTRTTAEQKRELLRVISERTGVRLEVVISE
jgi:hypothetical protein